MPECGGARPQALLPALYLPHHKDGPGPQWTVFSRPLWDAGRIIQCHSVSHSLQDAVDDTNSKGRGCEFCRYTASNSRPAATRRRFLQQAEGGRQAGGAAQVHFGKFPRDTASLGPSYLRGPRVRLAAPHPAAGLRQVCAQLQQPNLQRLAWLPCPRPASQLEKRCDF